VATIDGLEEHISEILGSNGDQQLPRMLQKLIDVG